MRSEGLGIAVVAGLLVAGTACTTGLGQGNGILSSSTRGVVLTDGGTHANAGMDTGNTCFVDPKNGFLGTERDYPGVEDEVEDIGRYYGTDSILVASDRGLHVGSADPASYDEPFDLVIGGIVEARLAENDIGVLVRNDQGCTAGWYDANEGTTVDPSACEAGQLTIDPDLGDLFVSTNVGIVHVPKGATTTTVVDPEADLAVFDSFTGLLYTAEAGGTWVRATDGAGNALWTTDLAAPVISIDDLGWQEGVTALVTADGADQVWIIDAWTGEASLGDEVASGATGIVTSRNGRDFGLVGSSQVAFREFARHVRE